MVRLGERGASTGAGVVGHPVGDGVGDAGLPQVAVDVHAYVMLHHFLGSPGSSNVSSHVFLQGKGQSHFQSQRVRLRVHTNSPNLFAQAAWATSCRCHCPSQRRPTAPSQCQCQSVPDKVKVPRGATFARGRGVSWRQSGAHSPQPTAEIWTGPPAPTTGRAGPAWSCHSTPTLTCTGGAKGAGVCGWNRTRVGMATERLGAPLLPGQPMLSQTRGQTRAKFMAQVPRL